MTLSGPGEDVVKAIRFLEEFYRGCRYSTLSETLAEEGSARGVVR